MNIDDQKFVLNVALGALGLLILSGLLIYAQCGTGMAPVIGPLAVTPTTTAAVVPSVTQAPTVTETPVPTATQAPVVQPHVHTPEPISETSSVTLPSVGGSNFASLPLPPGTRVVVRQASDGTQYPYNFYYAPTHEVVLVNEQQRGTNQEMHEFCHAHQHWSINGGAETGLDLTAWYGTAEGQSFMTAVEGLASPWQLIAVNGLEDFAWTCTFWYKDSQRLLDIGGEARYDWARRNLP